MSYHRVMRGHLICSFEPSSNICLECSVTWHYLRGIKHFLSTSQISGSKRPSTWSNDQLKSMQGGVNSAAISRRSIQSKKQDFTIFLTYPGALILVLVLCSLRFALFFSILKNGRVITAFFGSIIFLGTVKLQRLQARISIVSLRHHILLFWSDYGHGHGPQYLLSFSFQYTHAIHVFPG